MKKKDTPLISAIEHGADEKTVATLIDQKADVNARGVSNKTALICAAGNPKVLQLLLERNADIHAEDMFQANALYHAINKESETSVLRLVENGADVNLSSNVYNKPPLLQAAAKGLTGIVTILLAHKANVNQSNLKYMTALMAASKAGHAPVVQVLLKANADITCICLRDRTALEHAKDAKHQSVIDVFHSFILEAQMLVIASGFHPRLGQGSDLYIAGKNTIWDRNLLRLLKEALDERQKRPIIAPK